MDIDIVKRFICGAKEAYKKVDNHSFNFPITIESAYRLATNIEKLLKEHEPILLENQHKPYGISTNANSPWISRCPRCGKKVEGKQTRFCKYCGQAVRWEND